MVTYDFYLNTYLGEVIPEKHFSQCIARAKAEMDYISGIYRVVGGDMSRSMAICAMAEAVYIHSRQGNISASSAGNVSVQYRRLEDLSRQMYDRACIYLDIYRGV